MLVPIVCCQILPSALGGVSPELTRKLEAVAEEAILAKNEILFSGDISNSLTTKPLARRYQTAMQKEFDNEVEVENVLKSQKIDYDLAETSFVLVDVFRRGNHISLTITELTKRRWRKTSPPEFTSYSQDYIFDFSYLDTEWIVSKVTRVPIGAVPVKGVVTFPKTSTEPLSPSAFPPQVPTTNAPPGYVPHRFHHAQPLFRRTPLSLIGRT